MRHFDNDYVRELMVRLNRLTPGTKPRWGAMTATEMVDHLTGAIKYSVGKAPQPVNRPSFVIRHIVRPLLLSGLLPMPRNIKVERSGLEPFRAQSDIETLHAVLEEYLGLVQADELSPPPHPAFGPMSVDAWARLHYLHFEHHLKQFGL